MKIQNETVADVSISTEQKKDDALQAPLEFAQQITDLAYDGFKLTFEEFKKRNYQIENEALESINCKFSEILELTHWTLLPASFDINNIKDKHSIEYDVALEMIAKIKEQAKDGIEICKEHTEGITKIANNIFNKIQEIIKIYLDKYIFNA